MYTYLLNFKEFFRSAAVVVEILDIF